MATYLIARDLQQRALLEYALAAADDSLFDSCSMVMTFRSDVINCYIDMYYY